MLQVDGSRHEWLQRRGPWLTLIGGIDDATGTGPPSGQLYMGTGPSPPNVVSGERRRRVLRLVLPAQARYDRREPVRDLR